MTTLEQIRRDILPPGTELLAGAAGTGRQVRRVQALKPRPPGLNPPRDEEIILISTNALSALDPYLSLARVISSLNIAVAAVAVRGDIPHDAIQQAERLSIPLLRLPETSSIAEIERDIVQLFTEQRSEWYQRRHAVLQELTALALQGQGLEAIARHIGQTTVLAAGFEDEAGEPLASYIPPGSPVRPGDLVSGGAAPAAVVRLDRGLGRLSLPVTVREARAGTVSVAGPIERLDEGARLVLEAGATAGAIELAREHAVLETVHRMQGDIAGDLIAGSGDRDELERRARRLGFDPDAAHVAVVFPAEPGVHEEIVLRVTRLLAGRDVRAPVYRGDGVVAVFHPVDESIGRSGIVQLAERLRRELAGRRPEIVAGVSRVHSGMHGFQASFAEAGRALELGRVLHPDRTVTAFDDLGVYRLLFAMRDESEMRAFHEDLLGRLERYDRERGTALIATLDAYLSARNATEVAAKLSLHRNSLLYRLRRIREITGFDLDDPETRLALHLAVRVGEALRARGHGRQ